MTFLTKKEEELVASVYEDTYGEPPTAEELENFMTEEFEWFLDEFEEAHGYPASSKEELIEWLDTQIPKDAVTVH